MAYEEPGGKDRPFSPHPKLSMPTTKSHDVRLKGLKFLGDLSKQNSEDICTVEEVQETRGTQKENNKSTGCRTP